MVIFSEINEKDVLKGGANYSTGASTGDTSVLWQQYLGRKVYTAACHLWQWVTSQLSANSKCCEKLV